MEGRSLNELGWQSEGVYVWGSDDAPFDRSLIQITREKNHKCLLLPPVSTARPASPTTYTSAQSAPGRDPRNQTSAPQSLSAYSGRSLASNRRRYDSPHSYPSFELALAPTGWMFIGFSCDHCYVPGDFLGYRWEVCGAVLVMRNKSGRICSLVLKDRLKLTPILRI